MGESLVSDASSLPEDRDAYSPDQSPVKRRAEVAAGAGAVAAAVAVEVPSAVILRSNSSREGHELMESPRMFGEGTRVNKPEGRANSLLYRKKINVSRSNSETGYKEGSRQILYCVHGVTFRHLKMHVSAMLKELEGAGNSPKIVTAGEPAGLDGDLISSSDAISSSRPMAESERADALKPLALDLLTLHAEDFKPSTNAQRRDGIPANEVARRIKARLKQEIRKQNRGKLLGMGAGVGLRWLRRKVRNYQRKNPAEEQS
ncbi:hypothetical protein GUITHDRAFT_155817 [Guillardia theta CCMP2712]|uniref:Uncharacterized protein n=1 Tax=Guillardia theta (strain CCMP2712) TaxID=905079 RepID=L1IEE7_GUITC|nr:hypothetical protein GUITHDRAFT_155817 [Guillardia theta CCMP2712]EKX34205.1 hypothetical protein GUITHDRAFT_155817 [Guillardia theta CCMP2712]|eukprot:XP_005821185.1 hypothetical protein GUITHDRAFT_155817 [Guillardia theta CCMP2712]